MPAVFDPRLVLRERPQRPSCHPSPVHLRFLTKQAPQAVTLHLQASCHAEGSGQPARRRQEAAAHL